MKGICPVCDQTVRVSYSPYPRQELLNAGELPGDIDKDYGDRVNYVCLGHDYRNMPCPGTDLIPNNPVLG